MLNVTMLSVVMLNVIMLSVVAPCHVEGYYQHGAGVVTLFAIFYLPVPVQ